MRNYKIVRNYIVQFTRTTTPKLVETIQVSALGAADACAHFENLFKGTADIVRMDIIPEDEPGNRLYTELSRDNGQTIDEVYTHVEYRYRSEGGEK